MKHAVFIRIQELARACLRDYVEETETSVNKQTASAAKPRAENSLDFAMEPKLRCDWTDCEEWLMSEAAQVQIPHLIRAARQVNEQLSIFPPTRQSLKVPSGFLGVAYWSQTNLHCYGRCLTSFVDLCRQWMRGGVKQSLVDNRAQPPDVDPTSQEADPASEITRCHC